MLKVADVMTRRPFHLGTEDDLERARRKLAVIRHLPVVAGGRVVGIVSDRDVLRAQASTLGQTRGDDEHLRAAYRQFKVADIMTADVECISPESPASDAIERMLELRIGCLPVVADDGQLIGIVTETDLMQLCQEMLLAIPGEAGFDTRLEHARRVVAG